MSSARIPWESGLQAKASHQRRITPRRQYRRILVRIKDIGGRALISDLREEHVREIRSRFLPAIFTADEAVMLLSMLWQFAKEHLAMQLGPNPTTDVKKTAQAVMDSRAMASGSDREFEADARPKPNAALALLHCSTQGNGPVMSPP